MNNNDFVVAGSKLRHDLIQTCKYRVGLMKTYKITEARSGLFQRAKDIFASAKY